MSEINLFDYEIFQETYHDNPGLFVKHCFKWKPGEGPTDYQVEIMNRLPEVLRSSVRGPHGLGKSALAAWLILWFSLTRDRKVDWKIPVTASVWRQLTKYLFPELHKWCRRLNWKKIGREPFNEREELLTLNLKLETGEAFALASTQPEAIEGAHATSLLYILDEAKAIKEEIWDGVEGAFATGNLGSKECFALAISTPGAMVGRFYDIQSRKPGLDDWWVRHVTVEEAIRSGRISEDWVEQRRKQWGETDRRFINRVLGNFAADEDASVIPLSWVERAVQRGLQTGPKGKIVYLGVDVAGATEGSDDTVIAPLYQNDMIAGIQKFTKGNIDTETMRIAGIVKGILDANDGCVPIIDVIGIGTGVADRLSEQGYPVVRFIASQRAEQTDVEIREKVQGKIQENVDEKSRFGFVNKRSAMWWYARELLSPESTREIALPDDDQLIQELTTPQWTVKSSARIYVESKADIRRRIKRSTDTADAVLQALSGDELSELINWEVQSGNLADMIRKAKERR